MDAIHDLDQKHVQIGDAIRYLENLEGKCSLRYYILNRGCTLRFERQIADAVRDLEKSPYPSRQTHAELIIFLIP